MKVVRQTTLVFKEGNSDKVYQVDLAEVGNGQYVVNFRYGRRGSTLKEGSKTTAPVSLASAETMFAGLEAEKRKKGYQDEAERFQPTPTLAIADDLPVREGAILGRLSALANGQTDFKTDWKPSRVVWRAGQLAFKPAAPFLVRLLDQATGTGTDDMFRYATIWAIARCADPDDVLAIRAVRDHFTNQRYSSKIRRVAGETLMLLLTGNDRQQHAQTFLDQLPDTLRQPLLDGNEAQFVTNLADWTGSEHPDYDVLELVYALLPVYPSGRAAILDVLKQVPLRPGYFRAVRHILKMAELRNDFEVTGLLACRFERTPSFYNKPGVDYYADEDSGNSPRYIAALGQKVRVNAELRKPNSRLAYSDRTRAYLKRRMKTDLQRLGDETETGYVRFATAVLLAYDKATDYTAPFESTEWQYEQSNNRGQGRYVQYRRQFPAYARAILLNQILYGAGKTLEFTGSRWQFAGMERVVPDQSPESTQTEASGQNRGLFNLLFDGVATLLGKSSNQPESGSDTPSPKQTAPVREEPYPQLWDQLPQAYVQLLVRARVDEIHVFAYQNLRQHPDYPAIEAKITLPLVEQLLTMPFEIPARWGVELLQKRLGASPDPSLIGLLLNSPIAEVRWLGLSMANDYADLVLADSTFMVQLLLSDHDDIRLGVRELLGHHPPAPDVQSAVLGRLVATLLTITDNTDANNARINDVADTVLSRLTDVSTNIDQHILADLLTVPVEATQRFAVRLMAQNRLRPTPRLFAQILSSPFAGVRELANQGGVTDSHAIANDPAYQSALLPELIPILIRTEAHEGVHQAVASLIQDSMIPELAKLDLPTILRLVYAHFRPAQETGLLALTTYSSPGDLTMRQVIALGNHELLTVRQWCWAFFEQNVARIRYERDEAIRLLDANWDDTRHTARQFFAQHFTADDWEPETLVAIADSVRPDVQAFGRELISRFFTDEHGPDYLLKLSQHPGTAVQLFTTNYLARYAANQPERLRSLSFFFRSVLMRPHRGRVAKDRVLAFLQQEGKKTEDNARYVVKLLTELSATMAIGDKATCIRILHDLHIHFPALKTPLILQETQTR